jgi:hypothetical protein
MSLGLRHQGVLLNACRGCDTAPKEDSSKALVRVYRSHVLNCHCGDPAKSVSYIEAVTAEELFRRMGLVEGDFDHYPFHYVTHLIHAAEILGYYHPSRTASGLWQGFYYRMVRKLHLRPESKEDLDKRLDAPEEEFAAYA